MRQQDLPAHQLAPTNPPPDACDVQPPFVVRPAHEVDAKQGPGSGFPCWVIEDGRRSHVAGLFMDQRPAECWRLALTHIYESGFRAGQRSMEGK